MGAEVFSIGASSMWTHGWKIFVMGAGGLSERFCKEIRHAWMRVGGLRIINSCCLRPEVFGNFLLAP